ncbi:MAG: hypothetical protein V3R58_01370, partial [candidate division NC10 bacterium]
MLLRTPLTAVLTILVLFVCTEWWVVAAEPEQIQAEEDYRATVWGIDGQTGWLPMLPEKGLDGLERKGSWSRNDQTVVGTADHRGAQLYFGRADWKNYEVDLHVTPVAGGNAQIRFRISADGRRFYMLDFLLGWKAVGISKVDNTDNGPGLQKISVVNHPISLN